MPGPRQLRIGTRSSPMALAQVERVRALITDRHADVPVQGVPLSTSGDRWHGDLGRAGRQGRVHEVDAALLDGDVDLVVHCVKDVPGDRPPP